jgi:hypothetical protein
LALGAIFTRILTAVHRCAWCRKAFTPPKRGRPPRYCSPYHRQRAYELRRAEKVLRLPKLLLGQDFDDFRTKAGIERAVLDILRQHGILPAAPKRPPPLRIIKEERDT